MVDRKNSPKKIARFGSNFVMTIKHCPQCGHLLVRMNDRYLCPHGHEPQPSSIEVEEGELYRVFEDMDISLASESDLERGAQ